MLARVLGAAAAVGFLSGCAPATCPEYRTFSGIYLDTGGAALTGEICVGAVCQPVRDWAVVGSTGKGRLRLDAPHAGGTVRLRVTPVAAAAQELAVPLLPYRPGRSSCAPTGWSRAVLLRDGRLVLADRRPAS